MTSIIGGHEADTGREQNIPPSVTTSMMDTVSEIAHSIQTILMLWSLANHSSLGQSLREPWEEKVGEMSR